MIASPLRSRASWTWRTISFHLDFDVVIVFHILIPVFLVGSRIPKEGNQFHRHLAQRQSQTKSDVQPLFSLLNQKSQKKKKIQIRNPVKETVKEMETALAGGPLSPRGLGTLFQSAFLRPAGSQWVPWVRQQTELRAEEHKVQSDSAASVSQVYYLDPR